MHIQPSCLQFIYRVLRSFSSVCNSVHNSSIENQFCIRITNLSPFITLNLSIQPKAFGSGLYSVNRALNPQSLRFELFMGIMTAIRRLLVTGGHFYQNFRINDITTNIGRDIPRRLPR